jgi:MFS family permease
MSIHTHSHLFHVFKNREIDSLYFMNALQIFATSLVNIFIPIYFFKLGIPIWAIILFYFLWSVYFIVLSYSLLPLVRYLSDKMMIFLGIPFLVTAFLLVDQISGLGLLFFIAPVAFSLYAVFFNIGSSFDFSRFADKEEREIEVGIGNMIMEFTRFASPFIGALIIVNSGFHIAILISTIILIISVVPLMFFSRRRKVFQEINHKDIFKVVKEKSFQNFHKAMFGYVTEKINTTTIWPLFIFVSLGSIEIVGEYISLGLLFGAIAAYFAGKISNKGKTSLLFTLTGVGQSIIWFFKTLIQSIGGIIGLNVGGYIFRDAAVSSMNSRYYELIQDKKDKGKYIMAQEIYYNFARIIIYPFLILCAFILSLNTFFTVSFIIAGILSLLFVFAGKK